MQICNSCQKTNQEVEFYPYLKSKCIECKKKEAKNYRDEKREKIKKLEEDVKTFKTCKFLQEIDPEGNLQSYIEELIDIKVKLAIEKFLKI
jgi:hypothetical protein